MPLRVDESRVLYALPRARGLRDISRRVGVAHSTVRRVLQSFSRRGELFAVFDYAYFGLTTVVYVSEGGSTPGSLPYGSHTVVELASLRGKHTAVLGLVPRPLARLYAEAAREAVGEGRFIEASEELHWLPIEELARAGAHAAAKLPERLGEVLGWVKRPAPLGMPDHVDLVLLTGKMLYGPFARAYSIAEKLAPLARMPPLSHQSTSYHFRRHVRPGWLYTTVRLRREPREAPLVALELRGVDAARVAKALALLPFWGSAYAGEREALYLGQVSCDLLPTVYELLQTHRVDAPEGLMLATREVKLGVPLFWRFLDEDGSRWRWVEERVRVPSA